MPPIGTHRQTTQQEIPQAKAFSFEQSLEDRIKRLSLSTMPKPAHASPLLNKRQFVEHHIPLQSKEVQQEFNAQIVAELEKTCFSTVTIEKLKGIQDSTLFAIWSNLKRIMRNLDIYSSQEQKQIKHAFRIVKQTLHYRKKPLLCEIFKGNDSEPIRLLLNASESIISSRELFYYINQFIVEEFLKTSCNMNHIDTLFSFTIYWLDRFQNTQIAYNAIEELRALAGNMKGILSDEQISMLTSTIERATVGRTISLTTLAVENIIHVDTADEIETTALTLVHLKRKLLCEVNELDLFLEQDEFNLLPYNIIWDQIEEIVKASIANQSHYAREKQLYNLYSLASRSYELGDYSSASLLVGILATMKCPSADLVKLHLQVSLNWTVLKKTRLAQSLQNEKSEIPPLRALYAEIQSINSTATLVYKHGRFKLNMRKLKEIATLTGLFLTCKAFARVI